MSTTTNARTSSRQPAFGKRVVALSAVAPITLVVSTFLLLSMGGAIVAAPLSIPLLSAIATFRSRRMRAAAIVVATLTMAEVAWAVTYLVVGEAPPWIWLLPALAALATIIALLKLPALLAD